MPSNIHALSPDLIVDRVPNGSVCGVWQTATSRYLLTAAHVLDPGDDFVVWSAKGQLGAGLKVTGMQWIRSSTGSGAATFLDAGLVEVQMMGPLDDPTAYPWSSNVATWTPEAAGVVSIRGKFGAVTAVFGKRFAPGQLHLHGRPYWSVIGYQPMDGETRRGDSGGPVFSLPDETLIGMHLGVVADATLGDLAIVLPIEDIVDTYAAFLPGFSVRP